MTVCSRQKEMQSPSQWGGALRDPNTAAKETKGNEANTGMFVNRKFNVPGGVTKYELL